MGVQFAGNILVQANGGPLPISQGGTGQTTAPTAINALLPTQTGNSGKVLTTDGTNVSWANGGVTAGGSDTQIQFNDSGSLGGLASLVINKSTGALTGTSTFTNIGTNITGAAATLRPLKFQTAGSDRWIMQANNAAETGSAAGSNFEFIRVADNGATTNQVFTVARNSGAVDFKVTPTVNGSPISGSSDANTLTGTTLASNVVNSSLTSVGTITSGTWSGSFGAVSGANLTSLNASNLSSGTVGTARLGTGTANSTTYLRGDGTWATPTATATSLSGTGTPTLNAPTTKYVAVGVTAGGLPIIQSSNSSAAVDNRMIFWQHENSGEYAGYLINDAANSNTKWFSLTRSGITPATLTLTANSTNLAGLSTGLQLNGAAGTAGQMLMSNGNAAAPTWSPSFTWTSSSNTLTVGSNITTPAIIQVPDIGSGNTAASSLTIRAGDGNGTNVSPGALIIRAGNYNSTNTAASSAPVQITGGSLTASMASSQAGGAVQITGGTSSPGGTGTGGTVTIAGGAAGNTGAGGNVVINSGTTPSGTSGGYVAIGTAGTTTVTERLRFLSNGAWSVGSNGTSTGTTGQVLTSQGSTSAPIWSSVSATSLSATASTPTPSGAIATAGVYASTAGGLPSLWWNNSSGAADTKLMVIDQTNAGLLSFKFSNDAWNSSTTWLSAQRVSGSNTASTIALTGNSINLAGLSTGLQLNGSAGTSGQVLVSNGNAAAPTWQTFTPTIGNTIQASAGNAMSIIGGAPSTSTSASGNALLYTPNGGSTSGNSGAVSITTGDTTNGTSGAITIRTGGLTAGAGSGTININSGTAGGTGASGQINIYTSNGGSTSGNSGILNLYTGTTTSGNSGNFIIATGNAAGTPGTVSLTAGASSTSANGGPITLTAGASASGTGGSLSLTAGAGTAGAGGGITLTAGGGFAGTGGNILLQAGNGNATQGGIVTMQAGLGNTSSSTPAGDLVFKAGQTSAVERFRIVGQTGAWQLAGVTGTTNQILAANASGVPVWTNFYNTGNPTIGIGAANLGWYTGGAAWRGIDCINANGENISIVTRASNNQAIYAYNWYQNSGGTQVYTTTNGAGTMTYDAGTQQWRFLSAASGTAGATPTFTQNLTVGTTTTSAPTFTSTVANGTAPLTVTSSTVVPNLNVSQLLGSTWVSPGAIGSTTANTGAFTTLGAQSLNVTGSTAPANGVYLPAANSVSISTGSTEGIRIDSTGNLLIQRAGAGLRVKEGTNAKMGVATLVAGTVTVSNTSVTANSRIFLTTQSVGGTAGFLVVSARTAGTSFTILSSSASDTSTVAWLIVEPA